MDWILDTSGKGQCPLVNIFKQVLTARKEISSEVVSSTTLQPVYTLTTTPLSGPRAKAYVSSHLISVKVKCQICVFKVMFVLVLTASTVVHGR